MRRAPWTTWLAWAAFTLTLLLYAVGITIQEIRGESAATQQESWIAKIGLLLAFLGFAAVGALVASRQPRNAVGWIFSAIGLLVSVSLAAGEWAGYTFEGNPGSLPGGTVAGWLYLWAWFPAIGLIAFVPLLFPDGHVPGPRWRVVQWGLATLIALITLLAWFVPGPMNADETPPWPDNPLGLGVVEDVSDSLSALPAIAFLLLVGASVASMVVRFRRSRGDERQQLKWMTLAVVVLALSVGIPEVLGGDLGDLVFAAAVALLPVSVGIAMLKYRLYDVDVVIRKTLVYVPLTVVLAATYAAVVVGAQAFLRPLTGESDLAIAASTLVVAALFLPVRARVQQFVDRRFYRRRYDAHLTLGAFGTRLREEVDLGMLERELHGVVTDTMQPAHASVWLRTDASP